jgi:hypothetical protein
MVPTILALSDRIGLAASGREGRGGEAGASEGVRGTKAEEEAAKGQGAASPTPAGGGG